MRYARSQQARPCPTNRTVGDAPPVGLAEPAAPSRVGTTLPQLELPPRQELGIGAERRDPWRLRDDSSLADPTPKMCAPPRRAVVGRVRPHREGARLQPETGIASIDATYNQE